MNKTKRILTFGAFILALGLSISLYNLYVKSTPFFTTTSPTGIYTVNLTGQKERPLFFTVEVSFDVLKNGKSFWSNQNLHSGDAFDLSFEAGYPDYVWLSDNVIRFYNEKHINADKPKFIIVKNQTGKTINYLKVESEDKYLIFDLKPGTETKLIGFFSRGDTDGIQVEGKYENQRDFEKGAVFTINRKIVTPPTYNINITEDNVIIESPSTEE